MRNPDRVRLADALAQHIRPKKAVDGEGQHANVRDDEAKDYLSPQPCSTLEGEKIDAKQVLHAGITPKT